MRRQLTQASVLAKGIVRATIIPLVGDARGMEAQPLILPGVATARGVRDVLVLPSMADVVRGVDAHDGSVIWQTTLGMPVTGSNAIDATTSTSTGAASPPASSIRTASGFYQVCWVSPGRDRRPAPERRDISCSSLNLTDGGQVDGR